MASAVPVIDIAGLFSSDVAERAAVAEKIGAACADIGFFIVVNHGIAPEVINGVWQKSSEFFALPMEEKKKFVSDDEAKYPYGYAAPLTECVSKGKAIAEGGADAEEAAQGDVKETFSLGPKDPAAGMPPRRMPESPEGFAGAMEVYFDEANNLAGRLLSAFALALSLPEDWFECRADKHISALRANNYPDQAGMEVPAGSIRCSAHTDYGTLTILRSGGPGLQVSKDSANPVWVDVPDVENGFVINLGDLMRRWTNDKWSSTLHRVVNPTDSTAGRRMSLAFFHNLNKEAIVETIPSCLEAGEKASYEPIVAGEFLMLKHLASNGKVAPDAHLRKSGA